MYLISYDKCTVLFGLLVLYFRSTEGTTRMNCLKDYLSFRVPQRSHAEGCKPNIRGRKLRNVYCQGPLEQQNKAQNKGQLYLDLGQMEDNLKTCIKCFMIITPRRIV